jgi:hypothetical protein
MSKITYEYNIHIVPKEDINLFIFKNIKKISVNQISVKLKKYVNVVYLRCDLPFINFELENKNSFPLYTTGIDENLCFEKHYGKFPLVIYDSDSPFIEKTIVFELSEEVESAVAILEVVTHDLDPGTNDVEGKTSYLSATFK